MTNWQEAILESKKLKEVTVVIGEGVYTVPLVSRHDALHELKGNIGYCGLWPEQGQENTSHRYAVHALLDTGTLFACRASEQNPIKIERRIPSPPMVYGEKQ